MGLLSLRRRRALFPYLLLGPGLLWLIVFYLVPSLTQGYVSLETGSL
ncbi:MAG: spermidine/putrescine transport system permease protein, partial [Thermoleophilaceae bacterium]|nr:spermidine/putrescine transport system permease protein [Thermoleophilaceae bacterium]